MKTKEMVPHGEIGHFCHGGCSGYAKGGVVSQDALDLADIASSGAPLAADPEMLGAALREARGAGPSQDAKDLADIAASGGMGIAADPEMLDAGLKEARGYAEGGVVESEEKKDPSEIPEDVREYIEKVHKDMQESRPDENWRITRAERKESVAPYKKDDEEPEKEMGFAKGGEIPGYDEGAQVPDPNKLLADLAPMGTGTIAPSPAPAAPAQEPVANIPPPPVPSAPIVPRGTMPAPTEQDFMDKANKMLGLNPSEQANFMKLLGSNAQKGQIGAGIAGIGDAIASGGTLGKVNPGSLHTAEDLIQGKTKEGIEGMQTIRGNQEKTQELSDKLQSRDPNSPLSKYAQKAYAGIGKKLGLDLSHASASLIGDVSGKGVEALNTEYQNQLKQMGLQLQKEQVEATKANQEAERRQAASAQKAAAVKELADQGFGKKIANKLTASGRSAQSELEKEASGASSYGPDVTAYAQKHGITPAQAQAVKDKRTAGS